MLRNNLIEAFLQSQKLSLDAMQETPVHIQPAENMKVKGRGRNPKGEFIIKTMNEWQGNSMDRHRIVKNVLAMWAENEFGVSHTWHTPSWCPLRQGYSCRWVSIRVGWFLRRHCAPHRKCGPAHQWCHCPWRGGRVGNNRNQLRNYFHSLSHFQECDPSKFKSNDLLSTPQDHIFKVSSCDYFYRLIVYYIYICLL